MIQELLRAALSPRVHGRTVVTAGSSTTVAPRHGAARHGALGTVAALASVMTAGVAAAFLALLVSDQPCVSSSGSPSADAKEQIPSLMLATYERVGSQYGLPWSVLAGIGEEECDHGRNPDPSCSVQPGSRGPGTANQAGASGPMQIGVGGAAGDSYDLLRRYLPRDQRELGPHDPTVAVELAALVLTKEKGAPRGKPIDSYGPYVRAYNGSGPAAAAYANRVIADAHSYQGSAVLAAGVGCASAAGTYVNPFEHSRGLSPERIDMGVDYSGHGPIVALGAAKVTYASHNDSGWAYCGAAGAITIELLDGPDQGRLVYIAEGIAPSVGAGHTVSAGETIATFTGSDCIEIGWSASASRAVPEAAVLSQQAQGPNEDPGDNRTFCGNDMSELLASLGAPAGLSEGRPVVGSHC
jgi:hypothetical protein